MGVGMSEFLERVWGVFVGLKMLCVLEVFDYMFYCLEQGEIMVVEVIDVLFSEEYFMCEIRWIDVVFKMVRLVLIKMLEGFDFFFQLLFDCECIVVFVQFDFIWWLEVVYFLGLFGIGKFYFVIVFGVVVVKVGWSVYWVMLVDLVEVLFKVECEGCLIDKICFYVWVLLLIVDEIGYLLIIQGGVNLFFQFVNVCYEKGVMIFIFNCGFVEWGEVFGDFVVVIVFLDRFFYYVVVV